MVDGILVAFLFNVGRNSATFGFGGSKCDRMSPDDRSIDIRTPILVRRDAMNAMLEGLDRGLPPVVTWQQFYTWLGRGHGWAYFTAKSADELLPIGLPAPNIDVGESVP